jgi:hypothetical protein
MLGLPRDHETYEYALLQLLAVLSLYLCLSDWEAGPERARPSRPARARCRREHADRDRPHGARRVRVEPWPFTCRRLRLALRRRRLPAERFADLASLRAVWQRTAPELVPVELS